VYLRTKKYVQQNSGGADETRKAILDQRAQQNSERRTKMQGLASDLLGSAPLYLNGARLDSVGAGDARNRFARACQELISFSFPNLKMLKGATTIAASQRLSSIKTISFPEEFSRSQSQSKRY